MKRHIPQIAAMLTLTASFAVLSFTDNLITKAGSDEDLKTADAQNTVADTEITTAATAADESDFQQLNITDTEIPYSEETSAVQTSETTAEETTTVTTAAKSVSGSKELGSYSSDFTSLTSDELSSLYTDGFVIVGDSIASGFKVYNRLPERQVMAVGSLGARNIHDFKVTLNGAEYAVADSISILKPKYICMSMGMNDLNIGTMDEFIQNYTDNINELLAVSPDSTFIIMAITPIAAGITHSTNEKIDTYNNALKQMVEERNDIPIYYVNAAQALKSQWNSLDSAYSGGDGIHLTPTSYDALLTYLLGALSEIDSSYTNEISSAAETTVASWQNNTDENNEEISPDYDYNYETETESIYY